MRRHLRVVRFAVVSGRPQDIGAEHRMDDAGERTLLEHTRLRTDAAHFGRMLPRSKSDLGADPVSGGTSSHPVSRLSHEIFCPLDDRANFLRRVDRSLAFKSDAIAAAGSGGEPQ